MIVGCRRERARGSDAPPGTRSSRSPGPDAPYDRLMTPTSDRARLLAIAEAAMRERGLDPHFPPAAIAEVRALSGPPSAGAEPVRDLRSLLWCSIDNDDSRDLDQLSVAQPAGGGAVTLLVAIADVDAAVPK